MKSDRETHGLHGPVRSVRTEGVALFDSISQEGLGNRWADEELLFDTKGKLIERASTDHYIDQVPFRLVYTYDEQSRMIERKGYNENGSEAVTTVYSYDSEGNKTGQTYRYPGGQGKHQTVYDHRGNVTESALYLPDGTLTTRDTWTYTYKTEGNRVEEEFWHKHESRMPVTDENGTAYTASFPFGLSLEKAETAAALIYPEKGTWQKRVIIYDDAGHILEKIEYNPDGTWDNKENYDAEGRVVEKADNWTGKDKTTYRYNERGLLAKINQVKGPDGFSQEPIDRKYFYTYDEIGNLTEAVAFESDGSLYDKESYTNEYDSIGNWTRKQRHRSQKQAINQ